MPQTGPASLYMTCVGLVDDAYARILSHIFITHRFGTVIGPVIDDDDFDV